MKKILLLCLSLFFVFVFINPSWAHSTKGRIKVVLDKDTLVIDDIAYFAESYVHRHLYRGKYKKSEKRFYVNKFINLEQNKNHAVINFKTLDAKLKNIFNDTITINRLENGRWVFNPQNGEKAIEMFTYIKKSTYYYNKYVLPISAAGLALALSGLGFIRIKKRKELRRQS
ncbi:MAG: hypothetical protein KAQ72_02360 [Desulfobacula sp.]|nr:hypothetical protein [Desulfobacula sp.]